MRLLTRYKDEELIRQAEKALSEDPSVDASRIDVGSVQGVVTLSGTVHGERVRAHAVNSVERALQRLKLRYERVVDNLRVS